jgi:DNA integrity scanning protein DisA with diadenylate cyclase activity
MKNKLITIVYFNFLQDEVDFYDMPVETGTENENLIKSLNEKGNKKITLPLPLSLQNFPLDETYKVLRKEEFENNIRYYLINYNDSKSKINNIFNIIFSSKKIKKMLKELTEEKRIEFIDELFSTVLFEYNSLEEEKAIEKEMRKEIEKEMKKETKKMKKALNEENVVDE